MNEQFYNTSRILLQGRHKNYSMQSQDYSVQTKTTILLQESQKQTEQTLKKTASLRSIRFDDIQHGGRESLITIISTVREKGFQLQQYEQDSELNSKDLIEQSQVNYLKVKNTTDNQQNKKAIAKYKYIYQPYANYIQEQQHQLALQSNLNIKSILTPNSLARELELLELRQQHFEYKQIINNPLLFHLKNLNREEQIYHLLSKNSFEHPWSEMQQQNMIVSQKSNDQNPEFISANKSENIQTCFTISGSNDQKCLFHKTLNQKNSNQCQNKNNNEQLIQTKTQLLIKKQLLQIQSHQNFGLRVNQAKISIEELDNLQIVELFMNGQTKLQFSQLKDWIEDLIDQKQPYENYIHKFIFHKKYKDFESEEQKYQGVSRFHNLNRMFMHNIIKILSKENLHKFSLPLFVANKISFIVNGIKNEAFKKYNNGKSKTCFFNHYHYNLLFLQLNKDTLKLFQKSVKDLEMHQLIFGINLQNETLNCSDVTYCNLIKFYIYRIVYTTIDYNIQCNDYNNCVRLQYVQRVLNGIKKLSEGLAIKRF